jgi:endonuclease III
MRRQERAQRIQRLLDEHFPAPEVPLRHEDPFTLLVAVVLSAQCTDVRVNEVTPVLFGKARTPQRMAELSEQDIRAIIRPCGLSPQKAKAIKALSRQLAERHGGEVPRDLAALEELPGVGHKTASVVMSQAFGVPAFPVDTHIHRLGEISDDLMCERVERVQAEDAIGFVTFGLSEFSRRDQVDGEDVFEQFDIWRLGDGRKQGLLNRLSRHVLHVKNPSVRMTAFLAEVGAAAFVARKLEAEVDEILDAVGSLADDHADNVLAAQPVAGVDRVAYMAFKVVRVRGDARDATLGVVGVRFRAVLFRDDGDTTTAPGDV